MKNTALTNETFSLPPDFDYNVKNDGSYFGVSVGRKMQFKIAFAGSATPDIRDRQWAADQKIKPGENADGIYIEFSSTQYGKVLSWVLSFGNAARPIEPPELVNEWKKHILALYEKVKS
jgi:hypothetical protein